MKNLLFLSMITSVMFMSCGSGDSTQKSGKYDSMNDTDKVRLITVDPGHFHAALVQKTMYDQVSPEVHVYAPEGADIQQHLKRISSYNSRVANPASWNEIVYTGKDFFEKMLGEKAGNVVVLSGNNKIKADYIARSIDAGLNVLADKPMIINHSDFPALKAAFASAQQKGLLLYDIMTERHEVTTILQKLLSQNPEVFGKLTNGSSENPAVTKISIHHFAKIVSGSPLLRPAWFFDVDQQGEGIVDVTTHLVDLVQWECFPEQTLSPEDIQMVAAKRWSTVISPEEFKGVTGLDNFPDYLKKDIKDGKLNVFSNGEMVYQIKGVFAKVSVEWIYQAPPGGGDTHYSVMHGERCDIVIKQGSDEKFVPTVYIENVKGIAMNDFTVKLKDVLGSLPFDSLTFDAVNKNSLRINIPARYRIGHEEHFGQVMSKFLGYLNEGGMPDWEVPNMITKYFTTTTALKVAKGIK